MFYNAEFLKYVRGRDQVEYGKNAEYRAILDISGDGNSSEIHTSFHSLWYLPYNFLDIHQLSRDLWPILYSSLMNVLLHISNRKFSSVNLILCFIESFSYLLLQKFYSSTKSMNHLLECHKYGFSAIMAFFMSCLLYSTYPQEWWQITKGLLHARSWMLSKWFQKQSYSYVC